MSGVSSRPEPPEPCGQHAYVLPKLADNGVRCGRCGQTWDLDQLLIRDEHDRPYWANPYACFAEQHGQEAAEGFVDMIEAWLAAKERAAYAKRMADLRRKSKRQGTWPNPWLSMLPESERDGLG